jgi:hypothetical protein
MMKLPEILMNVYCRIPLYMHEYGHTVDSRLFGISYLFAIGIPSAISAKNSESIGGGLHSHDIYWTETRANRRAARYFRKYYGVDWDRFVNNYPLE